MSGKPRSMRQAQAAHAARLRELGRGWAEIGAVFQATYRVNPRVALRLAHGWSQPQSAARWTARWPDDPKTFKNFSYWEQWPGPTGHSPSLETLDKLAQLYECKMTDLLADCRDYGVRTPGGAGHRLRVADRSAGQGRPSTTDPPASYDRFDDWRAAAATCAVPAASGTALQRALETIRQARASDLINATARSDEPGRMLRRRTLLLDASGALAVVAAAPVLEVPKLADRAHGDAALVGYAGEVVAGLRRLGGAVGPRTTLPSAMALRSAMAALAHSIPGVVTSQALTAYGDLTQLIGWLLYNLGDLKAASFYYDEARTAAYRADNNDLATYTLAAASQLAVTCGRPRLAIDHAQAAQQAARASGSPYAAAYAADVTARAYAAAGQMSRCQAALDREQESLSAIRADTHRAHWWYFYDRSFYWGTESECALRLDMPVDAFDAAHRAIGLVAPANLHNSAITQAFRADALIRQREVEEACLALGEAARLSTMNSSRRISRRIDKLRGQLRFADDTAVVHALDENLAACARARAASQAVMPPGRAPATAGAW
ncbi:MAG: hypothetical protein ACYCPF_14495 [Streptosporangiaceae bacterium]